MVYVVDLHYPNTAQLNFLDPLIRHREAFLKHKLYIRDCLGKPFDPNSHLYIIHQACMTAEIVGVGKPIIMMERLDCCTLSERAWIDHESVKQVWKIATTIPETLQNKVKGRYHAHLLDGKYSIPKQILHPEKIHPGPAYHCFSALDFICEAQVDLLAPRSIAAQFRGTIQYGDGTAREHALITEHRKKALQLVNQYPTGIGSDKALGRKDYIKELLNTKVCVSPWGFGELCYRDFEAMIAGCVLVKPESNYVLTWPRIFTDQHYVSCKHDLSDLHEKIKHVEDNWDSFMEMRRRNRDLILKTRKPGEIADHFGHLMLQCLEN